MVKRREPKLNTNSEPTAEQIEAFAAGADGKKSQEEAKLNPNAKRDYKAITIPFNEYEYEQLSKGVELSGRTKLNFMRYAMLKMTQELEQKQE